MLKTNPNWMRWSKGTSLNTSSSRSDERNKEKEVGVKPTSEDGKKQTDKRTSQPHNTLLERKILHVEQEVNEADDPIKLRGLFKVNKENDKRNKSNEQLDGLPSTPLRSKPSITKGKALSNFSNFEIKKNIEQAKDNIRRDWKLERFGTNHNRVGKDFEYETLRNRKLSSMLSLLFSKVAEERMGDKVEGTDKWDVNKIMFRKVSKKLITNCKYSREKQRLVLLLDSSPSCRSMSDLYSQISTESARFDDLDIYDAPNGYPHSIYDPRRKKYRKLNEEELNATLMWNGFNGRTVIYFGDDDASYIMGKAFKHCEVHWFYQCYGRREISERIESIIERSTNRRRKEWKDKLTIYRCNNADELIQAVRNMR